MPTPITTVSTMSRSQLIEVIDNPVKSALRASNSHDSRGFQDLAKTNPASRFKAKTLDVWTSANGYICLHNEYKSSLTLPSGLVNPESGRPPDGEQLIARFVVTRPIIDDTGYTARRDMLLENQRQLDFLPFIPDAMATIFEKFDLPIRWFWFRLHAYGVGNFYHETRWGRGIYSDRATSIGFVIHFPFILRPASHRDPDISSHIRKPIHDEDYCSTRDDPYIWSVTLTYFLETQTTRALLDGFTDSAFDDLYDRILRHGKHWIRHPLCVFIILLHVHIGHAAWDMDDLAGQVSDFEDTVLQEGRGALGIFNKITTRLALLGRALKFQSELTKFLIDTLNYLNTKIFPTQPSIDSRQMNEIGAQMLEMLTNFSYLTENYLESCRFLQITMKDALDYMNATLSAKDNIANAESRKFQDRGLQAQLEDADSNRTISIVTLVFLPPTAVAAVSSLSAFEWQKPGGGPYTPPFWMFWVISIVLTLIVVLAYRIFIIRWDKQRPEQFARATLARIAYNENVRNHYLDKNKQFQTDNSETKIDGRERHRRRRGRKRRSTRSSSTNRYRPHRFGVSQMV